MDVNKKTDCLISELAGDLCKVKVLRHPLYCALPWAIFTLAYIALGLFTIGMRPDIQGKILEPFFVFEIILVLAMSVSAAMSSSWLRIPDMRGATWINAVTLTLFAVFFVLGFLRSVMEGSFTPLFSLGHQCHKLSIVFGVLPAIFIWGMSMRGKTTRPILLSFMNTVSIGGMGYVGLRIICHADDMGHLCIYHMLPYLVLGFIAAIIGRRIYSW